MKSIAWNEVERVVRLDLKHRRGHVPSTQPVGSVLDHLFEEVGELTRSLKNDLQKVSPAKNPETIKEAGDVLGLLYHVCQKCGISEDELNEACKEKLRLRFTQPAFEGQRIAVTVKDANGTYTARALKSSASSTAGPEFAVKALVRKLSITNYEVKQSETDSTKWLVIEAAP